MSLADGGHLTHGHPLNFSGINYEFYSYGVSKETETIDYEAYKKQNSLLLEQVLIVELLILNLWLKLLMIMAHYLW